VSRGGPHSSLAGPRPTGTPLLTSFTRPYFSAAARRSSLLQRIKGGAAGQSGMPMWNVDACFWCP
jgi:hypothetical protein